MNAMNKLSFEDQKDIAEDFNFEGGRTFKYADGYLPSYLREAMKRNGVVRDANGNFVKVSV